MYLQIRKLNLTCQFWFDDNEPLVVRAQTPPMFLWSSDLPGDVPHIVSCPIGELSVKPAAVSLVGRPCHAATNVMRIHNVLVKEEKKEKEDFAVCLKFLSVSHRDNETAWRYVCTSDISYVIMGNNIETNFKEDWLNGWRSSKPSRPTKSSSMTTM